MVQEYSAKAKAEGQHKDSYGRGLRCPKQALRGIYNGIQQREWKDHWLQTNSSDEHTSKHQTYSMLVSYPLLTALD